MNTGRSSRARELTFAPLRISNPDKWTAETPNLYTPVLRL